MAKYKVNRLFVTGINGKMYPKKEIVDTGNFPPGVAKTLCKKGMLIYVSGDQDVSAVAPEKKEEKKVEKKVESVSNSVTFSTPSSQKPSLAKETKPATESVKSDPVEYSSESKSVKSDPVEQKPKFKVFVGKDGGKIEVNEKDDLTVKELKYALDGLGLSYKSNARKDDLFKLWMES